MSGSLAHSPAQIVARLLIDLGLGTAPAASGSWPVYYSNEPSGPDNCVTVYDTVGRIEAMSQTDGEVQEYHGFQVRVRSATQALGYARARAIAVALDQGVDKKLVAISTSAYLVYSVIRTGDLSGLGTESPTSQRRLFTINAVAALRQIL